jgi:hypothetical protein
MTQAMWDKFCYRFNVMELAVPLFETDPDGHVLKRYEECDRLLLSVTDQLVNECRINNFNFWRFIIPTSMCTSLKPSLVWVYHLL